MLIGPRPISRGPGRRFVGARVSFLSPRRPVAGKPTSTPDCAVTTGEEGVEARTMAVRTTQIHSARIVRTKTKTRGPAASLASSTSGRARAWPLRSPPRAPAWKPTIHVGVQRRDRSVPSAGGASPGELLGSSSASWRTAPVVRCRAAASDDDAASAEGVSPPLSDGAAAATYARRAMTPSEAWRRMWTKADKYHAHGVSGGAFTLLGGGILGAWAKRDVDALFGANDAAAEAIRMALDNGGAPEWWPVAVASLALAGICAVSGLPLGKIRGWRKVELSARSTLFQLVLTWQALRLGPGGESLAWSDAFIWQLSLAPFAWQTATSAYIMLATKDDKRSAALILVGAWLFGAQVFPAAAVIAQQGGVAALAAARPGLTSVWCHSLVGLVWLLNWSTLGASLR